MKIEKHTVKKYIFMEFIANKGRFCFDYPELVFIEPESYRIYKGRIYLKPDYRWYYHNQEVSILPPVFTKRKNYGPITELPRLEFRNNWLIDEHSTLQIYEIKTAMDFLSIFSGSIPSIKFMISINGGKAMHMNDHPELLDREIKRVEFRKTMTKIIV